MRGIRPRSLAGNERGFTLIELLVAMSLGLLVLFVVGGMMASSGRTQRDVSTATEASTAGQLIVRTVQAGVRNASRVVLTEIDDKQLLVARTADGRTPIGWTCQAWYFVPDDSGTLYMKRFAPAVITEPAASDLGSWTRLATGISASGAKVFEAIAGRVSIKLDVEGGDLGDVSINSTATMRILPNSQPECFEVAP